MNVFTFKILAGDSYRSFKQRLHVVVHLEVFAEAFPGLDDYHPVNRPIELLYEALEFIRTEPSQSFSRSLYQYLLRWIYPWRVPLNERFMRVTARERALAEEIGWTLYEINQLIWLVHFINIIPRIQHRYDNEKLRSIYDSAIIHGHRIDKMVFINPLTITQNHPTHVSLALWSNSLVHAVFPQMERLFREPEPEPDDL
jgi:hypothetical protein